MALRVLRPARLAARSPAVARCFSAEASKDDAAAAAAALAAEDALMEKLTKQQLEDAARTSTSRFCVTLDSDCVGVDHLRFV